MAADARRRRRAPPGHPHPRRVRLAAPADGAAGGPLDGVRRLRHAPQNAPRNQGAGRVTRPGCQPDRTVTMSTTRPVRSLTPARRIPIPGSRSSPADGNDDNTGTLPPRRRGGRTGLLLLVGLAAVGFTAVYLISDLIEVAQGGFSTFRLSLTYAGEAAIPLFVIGLYAVQRPRIGRLGLFGAVAYAYSYVFFTSTVVYALAAGTSNWKALGAAFGVWMTVHGFIMVVGGLAFGLAVVRAGV